MTRGYRYHGPGAFALLLGVAVAAAPAPAHAAPRGRSAPRPLLRDLVLEPPALPDGPQPAALGRRVVYLAFDGAVLRASDHTDDARSGVSAIVTADMAVPPFDPGDLADDDGLARDEIIARVVEDVRRILAPYDVEVVTMRPTSGHYHMVLVGSDCVTVAGRGDCAGIALRDCSDRMPDNIAFAFPYGLRVADLGATAAHEIGHSLGLAHTSDLQDVMYYAVQAALVPDHFGAGEVTDSSSCGNDFQDSHATLLANVGARPRDVHTPAVVIAAPADGAAVAGGMEIDVDASDDVAIDRVELWVDGALHRGAGQPPYRFALPPLADGPHRIEARAWDLAGNHDVAAIDGVAGGAAGTPPPADGELGDGCSRASDCASGLCSTEAGDAMCTEACGADADCPEDYACSAGGACWPTAPAIDDLDLPLGCSAAAPGRGAGGGAWFALALAALAALTPARRRRSTRR